MSTSNIGIGMMHRDFSTTNAAVTQMESDIHTFNESFKNMSMEQTYSKFKGSDLSFKEVCEIIEQMSTRDMTYDEFQHYYPMADELAWALET